jgi:hypothetical protein
MRTFPNLSEMLLDTLQKGNPQPLPKPSRTLMIEKGRGGDDLEWLNDQASNMNYLRASQI